MAPPKLKPALELSLPGVLPVADDAGAVEGDVLALFDACAPRLVRYARSFGLDSQAAEDVVQDAFIALFRHLRLGRSRHSLTGWLFRVTQNLALKQRQATRARQAAFVSELLLERIADPAHTPEESIFTAQRRDRLQSVVRALKPLDRQCLFLRSEGLSYRDIASALGISLGSVSKSLTRAFARLAVADGR